MAKIDFEKHMNALQTIVQDMEEKQLPLDQALKAFEEGMAHIKSCQTYLNEAEQRITQLTEPDNTQ